MLFVLFLLLMPITMCVTIVTWNKTATLFVIKLFAACNNPVPNNYVFSLYHDIIIVLIIVGINGDINWVRYEDY